MMADNPNCPSEDGPDYDHGSSILLVSVADKKDILLAGLKNGDVLGLDPDDEGENNMEDQSRKGAFRAAFISEWLLVTHKFLYQLMI